MRMLLKMQTTDFLDLGYQQIPLLAWIDIQQKAQWGLQMAYLFLWPVNAKPKPYSFLLISVSIIFPWSTLKFSASSISASSAAVKQVNLEICVGNQIQIPTLIPEKIVVALFSGILVISGILVVAGRLHTISMSKVVEYRPRIHPVVFAKSNVTKRSIIEFFLGFYKVSPYPQVILFEPLFFLKQIQNWVNVMRLIFWLGLLREIW